MSTHSSESPSVVTARSQRQRAAASALYTVFALGFASRAQPTARPSDKLSLKGSLQALLRAEKIL